MESLELEFEPAMILEWDSCLHGDLFRDKVLEQLSTFPWAIHGDDMTTFLKDDNFGMFD